MTGTAGLFALRTHRPTTPLAGLDRIHSLGVHWRGQPNEIVDAGDGWQLMTTGSASVAQLGPITVAIHGWVEDDAGQRTADARWICQLIAGAGIGDLMERRSGFAAIIVDASRHLAIGLRDFMGTRPLYWGARGTDRSFASEPLAIPLLHGERPHADEDTIADYLERRRPTDIATFVAGAHSIPANASVRMSSDLIATTRQPRPIKAIEADEEMALEGTRTRLDTAVEIRLATARRPSAHASGGVDSGVVAASAAHLQPATTLITHRVRGLHESDETGRAAQLASKHQAAHRIVEIDPAETFERVRDDILIHGPTHPTMWLSGATITAAGQDGHDRLLTGQLGDEWLTMAGGPLAHAAWSRRLKPAFAFAKHGISEERTPPRDMAVRLARLVIGGIIRRRSYPQHVLDTFSTDAWIQRTIIGIERLGSLNGVEIEFPFADRGYIEYVLGLDVWHRNRPDEPKRILRQAYSDLLPQSFVQDPMKANFFRVPELAFNGSVTEHEAWSAFRSGWVDAWRTALDTF